MTKEQLSVIFQEVQQEMKDDHFADTLTSAFQDYVSDPNGTLTAKEAIPLFAAISTRYNTEFLLRVLSKILPND